MHGSARTALHALPSGGSGAARRALTDCEGVGLTQQVAMLRKMHVRLNTAAIEISARGSDVTRLSMRCGALTALGTFALPPAVPVSARVPQPLRVDGAGACA